MNRAKKDGWILRTAALWLGVLLIATPLPAATAPDAIHYQGVLRDAFGDPLDGTYDVTFRFYDAAAGGGEILVDAHLAAGTGAVTVDGGLFAVSIGTGDVTDGGGAFPNDPYTSLSQVFRDFTDVWIEIQIGVETLSPRVKVVSAGHALNADFAVTAESANTASFATSATSATTATTATSATSADDAGLLDGLDSDQFLRSDQDDATSGDLTAFNLRARGSVLVNEDGPDGAGVVYFYDDASPTNEYLQWNDVQNYFAFSNQVYLPSGLVRDDLFMNYGGPDQSTRVFFHEGGSNTGEWFAWENADERFRISDDFAIDGTDLFLNADGPDGDVRLYFRDDGSSTDESLVWNDAADRFELSQELQALDLRSRGDVYVNEDGPNESSSLFFYSAAGPTGKSLRWNAALDRFAFNGDVSAWTALIDGSLRVNHGGPEGDGNIYFFDGGNTLGQKFGWDDSVDRFAFSENVGVEGSIYLNHLGPEGTSRVYFYNGGSPDGQWLEWDDPAARFEFSNRINASELQSRGNILVRENAGDGNGSIWFFENGSSFGERFFWNNTADRFEVSEDLWIAGDQNVVGAKNFVQNHPYDPGLSVVYTALEGDEAATFTRGTARLENGTARVPLGESFAWVTNPDIGLTAHLTPREGPTVLWVESVTPHELVVRADAASPADARFDYVVMGLRIGFEDSPVVRERRGNAPVPSRESYERLLAVRPERRGATPFARHAAMLDAVSETLPDRAAAEALRLAVGTYDPDVEAPKGPDPGDLDRAARDADGRGVEPDATETASGARAASAHANAVPANAGTVASGPDDEPDAAPIHPDAERLGVSEAVAAGDVLTLDPERPGLLRRAATMADRGVVGVATGPSVPVDRDDASLEAPVLVTGIAQVRVDAAYGAIRPGDLLVASPTPGHAMLAIDFAPGTILGKAMDSLDEGSGTIRVVLTLR